MLLQESGQVNPSSSPPPQTTTSPPSASSSPTHDFSFTVSFRPIPNPPPTSPHEDPNSINTYNPKTNNSTSNIPLAAIDLSPADDIFFHGHLLPLHHHHHHLPMDSFTLPIKDLFYDNPIGNTSFHQTTFSDFNQPPHDHNRVKSKPFSIFGIPKWKKRCENIERDEDENINRERSKKKLNYLDLGQMIKRRYMKMVRPLLSFNPKSSRSTTFNHHQSYSFSGNYSFRSRNPPEIMSKRRGMFSAPASIKTSPANSGILVASGTVSPAKTTTSESTMEELHAAIQAAIAHCKNSIAMEDKQ